MKMAKSCISESEPKSLGEPRGRLLGTLMGVSGLAGISSLFIWVHDSFPSWLTDWLRWRPTSEAALEDAEKKVFSYLKRPYVCNRIDIETNGTKPTENSLWTFKMNSEGQSENTPLVLLHGFASGTALWILNLDSLAAQRPLHTFDILGFGRSSRPVFNKDPLEAESQLVHSIEEWRKKTGLEKFILLGHSMGGFLATSYALKYPERIHHLILADPWGFSEANEIKNIRPPVWVKVIVSLMQPFNPLAGLRAAGPWGPRLVEKLRPDLIRKFSSVVDDHEVISNYIYHCNAQEPSGESAFKSMSINGGWAKNPMISRVAGLHKDIPITFIYGSRSWIDSQSGIVVKEMRPDSYVDVKMIMGAGHHVYADKADEFNRLVQNVCRKVDCKLMNTKLSAEEEDLGPNIISSGQKIDMKENLDGPAEVAGGPIFYSSNS